MRRRPAPLSHHSTDNFNPRTREGCDDDAALRYVDPVLISIHAPVKGATRLSCDGPSDSTDFNPRTREGCDVTGDSWDDDLLDISIHAPVKGATDGVLTIKKEYLQFQSTHP